MFQVRLMKFCRLNRAYHGASVDQKNNTSLVNFNKINLHLNHTDRFCTTTPPQKITQAVRSTYLGKMPTFSQAPI